MQLIYECVNDVELTDWGSMEVWCRTFLMVWLGSLIKVNRKNKIKVFKVSLAVENILIKKKILLAQQVTGSTVFHLKVSNLTPWFWFAPEVLSCVWVSEWITSYGAADWQLSGLTFSEHREEHSEISIRLPSPVSIMCVACYTPPTPHTNTANCNHLVFR